MGGGLDVEGDLRREGGEPKDARAVCQGTLKRYPDLPLLHRGPRTSLRNRCCGAPLLPHLLLHPPRVHWRRSLAPRSFITVTARWKITRALLTITWRRSFFIPKTSGQFSSAQMSLHVYKLAPLYSSPRHSVAHVIMFYVITSAAMQKDRKHGRNWTVKLE